MKRMMMICAVIALACGAMATSVKWGLNAGQVLPTATFADGSMLYLFWDNGGGGFNYSGVLADQESFSVANVLDTQLGSGSMTAGYYYNAAGQTIVPADVGGAGGMKPFYLVALSADGLSIGYTGIKNINIQSSPMVAAGNWNAGDFTITTVPEPTSMALLALGVAALGLRRKFRA